MNGGGGGSRPAPRPAPPPRPAPAPGRIRFPHRRPASPSRTGCAARPSRPGREAGARAAATGTRRALRARPERPPSPRPARAQGTATDAARPLPTPPGAPPRPDVGGCGGRAAARGRRRGGKRFLPFPGAQGPFSGRFYLRNQTKFAAAAAAFPRLESPRVKRRRWRAGGTPACWPGAGGERESRGGEGTPPVTSLHPRGRPTEKARVPRGVGQGRGARPNSLGSVPSLPTKGLLETAWTRASPKCEDTG